MTSGNPSSMRATPCSRAISPISDNLLYSASRCRLSFGRGLFPHYNILFDRRRWLLNSELGMDSEGLLKLTLTEAEEGMDVQGESELSSTGRRLISYWTLFWKCYLMIQNLTEEIMVERGHALIASLLSPIKANVTMRIVAY
jgi:hypothetical protein